MLDSVAIRRLALACILLLGCSGVVAQALDDDAILERVLAGRYDELRELEGLSKSGSPVAMYWWGALLQACVFGRCDPGAAKALWIRAAEAGHGRAKLAAMGEAASSEELQDVIRRIGAPATWEERVVYVAVLAGFAIPSASAPDIFGEGRRILLETAATEPRLAVLYAMTALDGPRYTDELRAMVQAGHSPAMEQLRRALMLSQQARYPELLAMAKAGDTAVSAALCETVEISEGYDKLPADLLPLCERALAQGYLGVARAMLRHHRASGNRRAAAFYAELCMTLGQGCASELAEYHHEVSGKSRAWQLWDAVAAWGPDISPGEADLPPELLREVFTIRTRGGTAQRACLSRRYDRSAKKFSDDPACPYLKPVAIPAEFLGGGR